MRLAARGAREVNGGEERVTDSAEQEALRHRGRTVQIKAALFTAAATVSTVLLG